jgi:hypothetical protein
MQCAQSDLDPKVHESLVALLDLANEELIGSGVDGPKRVMPRLVRGLDGFRRVLAGGNGWRLACDRVLALHPIQKIFLEDPFTERSSAQPRGYAGDAELLDYIYGMRGPDGASPLGRALFEYSTNGQSGSAVRERREVLARLIDETARSHSGARVLSLAAGHLREAEFSSAIKSRTIYEFVAFDQDADSLSVINQTYGNGQLATHQGSVRSLLAEKHTYRGFHFVYAAGLFDYLAERTAKRLTRVMFDMLAPGGRLLIANFAPSLEDIGYMEAFMRWHLIYRDEAEMAALSAEIPESEVAGHKIYWNSTKCMLFLEVERKC